MPASLRTGVTESSGASRPRSRRRVWRRWGRPRRPLPRRAASPPASSTAWARRGGPTGKGEAEHPDDRHPPEEHVEHDDRAGVVDAAAVGDDRRQQPHQHDQRRPDGEGEHRRRPMSAGGRRAPMARWCSTEGLPSLGDRGGGLADRTIRQVRVGAAGRCQTGRRGQRWWEPRVLRQGARRLRPHMGRGTHLVHQGLNRPGGSVLSRRAVALAQPLGTHHSRTAPCGCAGLSVK